LEYRADDPCAAELGLADAQPSSSASTAQLSRSPET